MITLINEGGFPLTINGGTIWTIFAIVAVFAIGFYLLRSIGLFVMARRAEMKLAFFAWIPLLWVYLACKLVGNVRAFGTTVEKLAIAICIIFGVAEILTFTTEFLIYFPIVGNLLKGRPIYLLALNDMSPANIQAYCQNNNLMEWASNVYVSTDPTQFVDPYGDKIYAINNALGIINPISAVLDLLSIIAMATVYIQLFRKYYPQHYMLAGILSLFGLFGPFVFSVRKREPVNYMDYIRERYQRFGYGPYYNPYNTPQGRNMERPPDTPFKDFAEKGEVDPGNPFEDFFDGNDKENKNDKDK